MSEYSKQIFELDYPQNLLETIFGDEEIVFPEDAAATVEYVLFSLTERERTIIHQRYQDHMIFEEIGKLHGVNRERVRQIEARALRKLRHPQRARLLKRGVAGTVAAAAADAKQYALDNCLKRVGADKLSDIAKLEETGQLKELRNLGKKSYDEIVACLRKHGYTVKGSDGIELRHT